MLEDGLGDNDDQSLSLVPGFGSDSVLHQPEVLNECSEAGDASWSVHDPSPNLQVVPSKTAFAGLPYEEVNSMFASHPQLHLAVD